MQIKLYYKKIHLLLVLIVYKILFHWQETLEALWRWQIAEQRTVNKYLREVV